MRRFGTIGFVVGATLCDSSWDSIVATDRDDWRRGVGDDGDWHGAAIAHGAAMVATLPKEHRVRYIAFRHGMGALGVGTDALGGAIRPVRGQRLLGLPGRPESQPCPGRPSCWQSARDRKRPVGGRLEQAVQAPGLILPVVGPTSDRLT